jgi:hypothetical protein
MSTTALGRIASDFEEIPVPANEGDWRMAWHPAVEVPSGQPHGANAFCVTARGSVVLVRSIWRAEVTLLPWQPEHEIPFRRVVPARDLARLLWMEDGAAPIYSRAAREAALT